MDIYITTHIHTKINKTQIYIQMYLAVIGGSKPTSVYVEQMYYTIKYYTEHTGDDILPKHPKREEERPKTRETNHYFDLIVDDIIL